MLPFLAKNLSYTFIHPNYYIIFKNENCPANNGGQFFSSRFHMESVRMILPKKAYKI